MSGENAPVAVGDVVAGKYHVERVLGAGGMGVVVAATHVQLDRKVAIKFLLPAALANPDVVSRFSREARAASKIESEHVARVIDVGVLDSGAPFMVMEYLDGRDLAARIAEHGGLSVEEMARYVLQACEALAEAHAAGIVHRDLKPANLFLAQRADKSTSVKVLDFGISKAPVGTAGTTNTQAIMGSPHYMSPEQLMSSKHVDHRSDVWSLGIVMFEALTGSPPFLGEQMPEIVAKILQAPTPSVRERRPEIPSDVDVVIAKCTAKSPADRYLSIAHLARALAPFAQDSARSVERISRVLNSTDPPPPMVAAPPSAPTTEQPAVAKSNGGQSNTTGWGATQAAIPKKGTPSWIFVAAGVVVLALVGVFAFMHGSSAPPKMATPQIPSNTIATLPAPPPAASMTLPHLPDTSSLPAIPSLPAIAADPAPTSAAPVASAKVKTVPVSTHTTHAPSAATTSAPPPGDPLHMGIK